MFSMLQRCPITGLLALRSGLSLILNTTKLHTGQLPIPILYIGTLIKLASHPHLQVVTGHTTSKFLWLTIPSLPNPAVTFLQASLKLDGKCTAHSGQLQCTMSGVMKTQVLYCGGSLGPDLADT